MLVNEVYKDKELYSKEVFELQLPSRLYNWKIGIGKKEEHAAMRLFSHCSEVEWLEFSPKASLYVCAFHSFFQLL